MPGIVPYLLLLLISGEIPQSREEPLFGFSRDQQLSRWYVVTDAVIGGTSRGTLGEGKGKYALFSGVVSGGKTGGFVSVWSRDEPMDLSRFTGLTLRLRGDGKTYRVALKMERGVEATQYFGRVTPPRSGWSVVRIRFNELIPMFRGTILNDAPPFLPGRTVAIGVMVSDKQEGAFELMVERISAYAE